MTDIAPETATVKSSAATAASRVKSAAAPALGVAASSAHDAYDALKEAAGEAFGETKTQVERLSGRAAERFEAARGDLEAFVQLRPARAIGIAAAVGLLVGLLMRGRSQTIYVRDRR
ncbi:hypothetical protein CFHF_19805 [Caulobacter flavus]|uniref:Uncharacterized protein n=1 Tax=Caulobacter flavus TaxID=1679497 RepID=A0A2N5CP39_9CAUL|nr:DUF883 family protein [Caulobacter flavus]AYV48586.1 hypothetical protein C1707_21260 [Caulobacter flavus]PLR08698.1 hypothetical protein CFHF_19805 [Caulobacter flavus]